MKRAIITGATGLLGSAVARHFAVNGVESLCLGTRCLGGDSARECFGPLSHYIDLSMRDISLLPAKVQSIAWEPGDECVFFNFAWRGKERLTDGSFDDQLNNAIYAAEAVRVAKKLGCKKYVNVGTIQETFAQRCVEKASLDRAPLDQMNYALAKLAARDMCKMIAYLEKIDYVHTRLSVPLAADLSKGSYIASVFRRILEKKPYEQPESEQLFDIVFVDEVAEAYLQIGVKGKNKADYFLGTSKPAALKEHFRNFESLVRGTGANTMPESEEEMAGLFSNGSLVKDTGVVFDGDLKRIINVLGAS